MWKKQEDPMGSQPEFDAKPTPDLESLGDALIESLMDNRYKKDGLAAGPQKVAAQDSPQPASSPTSSPTLRTYTEAVNEFTKNATAFMEQLPLLSKARTAYENAMKASSEMRKVLDAGEESLRTLMSQLEQGVNSHGIKPAPDKKNPELAKVEAIRGADETGARLKRFP